MPKIVFMGTPDFAVPTLEALIHQFEVTGVVTQPDRPAGRGGKVRQSPVKQVAGAHEIPVFQPEKLRKQDAIEELGQFEADVFVVAAFGQILPQTVLDMPQHGCINVHASLLPRWRGAAPIHAAIREGDAETGITIMQMDAGLDTGPILSVRKLPIQPNDTGQSLHDKLAEMGAMLLIETLPGHINGEVLPTPQDDSQATYAPQIKKEEGEIDWTQPADRIERLVRAFTPWPGTYTTWNGQRLKVLSGEVRRGSAAPGKVVSVGGETVIGTGDSVFRPTRLQLAGGKPLDVEDFVNGYQYFTGAELG